MLLQTSQEQLQVFLTAVGGMVQYAREDEAIRLQTVSARLPINSMSLSTMSHHSCVLFISLLYLDSNPLP